MTFAFMLLAAAFVLCVWSSFAARRDVDEAQAVIIPACACIIVAAAVFAMERVAHNEDHHPDRLEEIQDAAADIEKAGDA